jgi:hypothetical protein
MRRMSSSLGRSQQGSDKSIVSTERRDPGSEKKTYIEPIPQEKHLLLECFDDVTTSLLQQRQLDAVICTGGKVDHPLEGWSGEDLKRLSMRQAVSTL